MMIIDFYTETFGPLVVNASNKVYFQAWATKDRADVYEFEGASLKSLLKDNSTMTIIDSTISTLHRGKGSFSFLFTPNYQKLFLEFTVTNGGATFTL
jgi:hypothetical protein